MNMWNILNIEKTKDRNAIKNAFTKKRSVVSPEETKMLSSAYEFALRFANIKDTDDSYKEEMLLELAFSRNWKLDALQPESERPTFHTITRTPLLDDYINQMQKVYDNFFTRKEIMNWKPLIQQNNLWSTYKRDLEPLIQEFLIKNRDLPSEVWALFDTEYNWSMRADEFYAKYPEFAICLLIETCRRWKLDYSFIHRDSVFDYDNYVKYRRLTREAALENDRDNVRKYFDQAIDLYTTDAVLYEITADFYASQEARHKYGEFGPEYLHALNRLLKLHYNDSKYIRLRAEYYKSCEYLEEARNDYELAMKLNPEDLKIPYDIAESYNVQNNSGKAKSFYKYIKKSYQHTQAALEKQLSDADDRERISAIIDSNDRIMAEVFDLLK